MTDTLRDQELRAQECDRLGGHRLGGSAVGSYHPKGLRSVYRCLDCGIAADTMHQRPVEDTRPDCVRCVHCDAYIDELRAALERAR